MSEKRRIEQKLTNRRKKMSSEYNKHLRVMLPSLAPFTAAIIIVLIIWDIVFLNVIMPRYKEQISLQHGAYERVVISSSDIEEFPSLKKLNNLVTFRNEDDSRLNINTYIQSDDPIIVGIMLKSNEIAISGKMAERFGIRIGSRIIADFPIYDTQITYEVKAVLSYLSDLYDTQENQDFAFAIVGYDESLYNHSQGNVVYLLDDEQYGEYMKNDYSYSERYSIADEVTAIKRRIALYCAFVTLLILLFVLALALYLHKGINTETDKYYRDGYNASSVKAINRNDHVFFIGIPFLIEIMWIVFFQLRLERQIYYLLPYIVAMIIIFVCLSLSGGRRYGRAN